MLDLREIKKYYEITWFDGTVYHLEMPSQELLVKAMKLEKIKDVSKQFEALTDLVKDILNNNKENKKFTEKELSQLDLNTIQLIMEDYMSSVNDNGLGE